MCNSKGALFSLALALAASGALAQVSVIPILVSTAGVSGKVLLVDNASHVLLVDNASRLCESGGC